MYTMMAKTEEVTQAMKSVQNHAVRMYPLKDSFLNGQVIINISILFSRPLVYVLKQCNKLYNHLIKRNVIVLNP